MAKAATRAIVVQMPRRRSAARRYARKAGRKTRRVARAGYGYAKAGAAPFGVLLASGAVGYAQAKGFLNKIPTVGGSRALTMGIAGYVLTRLSSNKTARTVGNVAMIIGAFDFGSKQGGGKSALEGDYDDDDMEGDDYDDDDDDI